MTVISGPYCLVCGGHNVVRQRVWGIVAWTEQGPRYGWVERDICLDCQRRDAAQIVQEAGDDTTERA